MIKYPCLDKKEEQEWPCLSKTGINAATEEEWDFTEYSKESFDKFIELCDEAPEPNEKLLTTAENAEALGEAVYYCNDKITSTGGSTSYYELPENAKELQDLIEHKEMNYAMANIFKAAYRIGNKEGNDDAYDLNKILWFAERELRRIG